MGRGRRLARKPTAEYGSWSWEMGYTPARTCRGEGMEAINTALIKIGEGCGTTWSSRERKTRLGQSQRQMGGGEEVEVTGSDKE